MSHGRLVSVQQQARHRHFSKSVVNSGQQLRILNDWVANLSDSEYLAFHMFYPVATIVVIHSAEASTAI